MEPICIHENIEIDCIRASFEGSAETYPSGICTDCGDRVVMSQVDKMSWCRAVRETIAKNPDWIADTIEAASTGIKDFAWGWNEKMAACDVLLRKLMQTKLGRKEAEKLNLEMLPAIKEYLPEELTKAPKRAS